jgi:chorismate mutase
MSTAPQTVPDHVLAQMRDQITDIDRQLVALVNKRLKVVERLWRYKEANGIPVADPGREEWLVRYLTRCSTGPLSHEGLAGLYAHVLELTKRELGGV